MGPSSVSTAGNGAVVRVSTVPAPPVNLARVDATTLAG